MAEKKSNNQAYNPEALFDAAKKMGSAYPFDMDSAMNMYRKNMEVMAQAQKAMMDMVRDIATMNSEFNKQVMDEMRNFMAGMSGSKSLEERSQVNSEKMKNGLDLMMDHSRQLTDRWTKSYSAIGEQFQNRFTECCREMQDASEKVAKKH
jgi:hypothetical protein